MNRTAAIVIILVISFGGVVVAQEQDRDPVDILVGAVAWAIADASAQAVGEAVSGALSQSEALAGVESQVRTGAETLTEAGSQVRTGVETLAEVQSPVRAATATVADGVNAAVTEALNEFVAQLGVLIETLVAIIVLAFASFLAGLLIGIKRVEKLGCGVVIFIGLVAAILAATNLGAGAGILTAIAAGIVLPFAGTILAILVVEAGQRWIALLRSLLASFRGSFDQSAEDDDASS